MGKKTFVNYLTIQMGLQAYSERKQPTEKTLSV